MRSTQCCRIGVTIAAAASFAAVFAFTFAVIQPLICAAADLLGKARLMTSCLVIPGVANIVGALATSFPWLFVSRFWLASARAACFRSR